MFSTSFVDAAAGWLSRRPTRRSFLQRVAVVGSALSVGGLDYVLRPGTAYASVCGSGASCASGWTALCCTVNNGVNQCPPGAFAAGWWKADGASLCGGKARYYIDCQGRCTSCHCPRGSHFCGEGCWNCKPHCAHGGGCDERHVCRNVFRYGQCHQEIGCSGPVWCRVISCTPPWQWESCSRASATDDFTRSHSAPCLPTAWTPMQKHYASVGSQGSPLGAGIGPEHDARVGRMQRFQHGRMYYSHHTGAHFVLGALMSKYVHLDESASPLGLPTSDTKPNDSGHGQHNVFQHGAIYASGTTGAHAIWGPVYQAWVREGRALGSLGLPMSDTLQNRDGAGQHNDFERGSIYYSPRTGAHALPAQVVTVWSEHGRETGPLGYPTAESRPLPDGLGQHIEFEQGTIDVTPDLGTHAVWGPVFTAWTQTYGRESGPLGRPVTDTVPNSDGAGQHNDFENGSIYYSARTGAHALPQQAVAVWSEHGREAGPLGYPTTDAQPLPNGLGQHIEFEQGTIDVTADLGTHAVWGPIFTAWTQTYGRETGSLGRPVSNVYAVDSSHERCDFERGSLVYDAATGAVTQAQ